MDKAAYAASNHTATQQVRNLLDRCGAWGVLRSMFKRCSGMAVLEEGSCPALAG